MGCTSATPHPPDATKSATPTPAPDPWHLAWSDEFNGTAVDTTKWTVADHSTFGDGNQELECLMNRPENVRVEGGDLLITAQRETTPLVCNNHDSRFPNGRDFSSGMLESRDKASFQYGKFVVRAKTPTAPGSSQGLWPAFWMRPQSGGNGELDILEMIGTDPAKRADANLSVQTIHYDYIGTYPHESSYYRLPTGDYSSTFHTFAATWEPGKITWTIDGKVVYSRTEKTTPWLDDAFRGDFYLRLNLAVGGGTIGAPTANTVLPASYVIDYVRVYQRG
ncbi:MAG: hypothetical protein JWN80_1819 [Microbacteriaceae bacterium]|nr:hypothetical protein [Microbacteriaceae bacterium]